MLVIAHFESCYHYVYFPKFWRWYTKQ